MARNVWSLCFLVAYICSCAPRMVSSRRVAVHQSKDMAVQVAGPEAASQTSVLSSSTEQGKLEAGMVFGESGRYKLLEMLWAPTAEEVQMKRLMNDTLWPAMGATSSNTEVKKLGSGAFGTGWLATDTETDKVVVLKTFKSPTGGGPFGSELKANLVIESNNCNVVASVVRYGKKKGHPGAVHIADCLVNGASNNPAFIVQEYGGRELTDWLPASTAAWTAGVTDATRQMLAVLDLLGDAFYPNVLIHHDLKPANVVYTEDQGAIHIKVIDWGACIGTEKGSNIGKFQKLNMGTPGYRAPEAPDGNYDEMHPEAFDVYAVGRMYLNMLCPSKVDYDHGPTYVSTPCPAGIHGHSTTGSSGDGGTVLQLQSGACKVLHADSSSEEKLCQEVVASATPKQPWEGWEIPDEKALVALWMLSPKPADRPSPLEAATSDALASENLKTYMSNMRRRDDWIGKWTSKDVEKRSYTIMKDVDPDDVAGPEVLRISLFKSSSNDQGSKKASGLIKSLDCLREGWAFRAWTAADLREANAAGESECCRVGLTYTSASWFTTNSELPVRLKICKVESLGGSQLSFHEIVANVEKRGMTANTVVFGWAGEP